MASAFFAQRDTKTPMWCSFFSLALFTAGCAMLAPRLGAPGIGAANTIAVVSYGCLAFGDVRNSVRVQGSAAGWLVTPLCRQLVGCLTLGLGVFLAAPWLADVQTTSLIGLAKVLTVAIGAGGVYAATGDGPGRARDRCHVVWSPGEGRSVKMVIQRVSRASVRVEGRTAGAIETGFLVLVGWNEAIPKPISSARRPR